MKIEPTPLTGVTLITPTVHGDARGFFLETWHAERYRDAGIDLPFVQDNHSRSSRGILRGLHLQAENLRESWCGSLLARSSTLLSIAVRSRRAVANGMASR